MINKKKYEKSKITQFTKNRIIIRKGGYYPRRMYLTAILLAVLVTVFTTLLLVNVGIWFLFLYPLISLGLIVRYIYKKHLRFGEKISVNKNRVLVEFYGSSENAFRRVQIKKPSLKSMICIVSGSRYQFKLYKSNNSSISFTVIDDKSQNPLKKILAFGDFVKISENTHKDGKVLRFWSKSQKFKKTPKEVQNVSESLFEYRSDHFSITSENSILAISIKNKSKFHFILNKELQQIEYQNHNGHRQSIKFHDIASIRKEINESNPIDTNNSINVRLIVKLKNGKSIDLFSYYTYEEVPGEMEIIEIDKDFKNLTAIVDMHIKSSIDEDLDILDLEELKQEKPMILKSPLGNRNLNS